MSDTIIKLIPLTIKGEEAIRAYIKECQDYALKNPRKVKITEMLKKRLGTTEEYFEKPLSIVVTIRKDVNIGFHLEQINIKLEGLMTRYNVGKQDYTIEVT